MAEAPAATASEGIKLSSEDSSVPPNLADNFFLPSGFLLPEYVKNHLKTIAQTFCTEELSNDEDRDFFLRLPEFHKFLHYFSIYLREIKLDMQEMKHPVIIEQWKSKMAETGCKWAWKIFHLTFPATGEDIPINIYKKQDQFLQRYVPALDKYVDYKHVRIIDGIMLKQTLEMIVLDIHESVYCMILINGHGHETQGLYVQKMGEDDIFRSILSTAQKAYQEDQLLISMFIINTSGSSNNVKIEIAPEIWTQMEETAIGDHLQSKNITWHSLERVVFNNDFSLDIKQITQNKNLAMHSGTEQYVSFDEIIKCVDHYMIKHDAKCQTELVLGVCYSHNAKYEPSRENLIVRPLTDESRPRVVRTDTQGLQLHLDIKKYVFLTFMYEIRQQILGEVVSYALDILDVTTA